MEMVTLRTYFDPVDAGIAKTRLEAGGIECALADENVNSWMAAKFAVPVRLMVNQENVQEALTILDAPPSDETEGT
jgi:Putative prokaryotic signal transducing protein